ncbi:probable methyltransferase PMT24 [Oryza glaberrima]|nr:probable methyltransferase PMT24 [Oryza glaberrima]
MQMQTGRRVEGPRPPARRGPTCHRHIRTRPRLAGITPRSRELCAWRATSPTNTKPKPAPSRTLLVLVRSMAGLGRSSRGASGKRGAASSSSSSSSVSSSSAAASTCVYYATTAVLVTLCVAGAYFLTSASSASLAGSVVDGDGGSGGGGGGGTVTTTYRHTTRSSFAYEVSRPERKAPPAPPRDVERVHDAAARGRIADEDGAEEEHGDGDDDPRGKPDLDDHGADEEETKSAVAAMDDAQRREEDGSVSSGEANAEEEEAAATTGARRARVGEDEEEAAREESQELHLQMPLGEPRAAAAVEEKSLDGGVEEESNAGQRQREEEQIDHGVDGGASLRREAQEEGQIGEGYVMADHGEGEEMLLEQQQQQPEEERGSEAEAARTSESDAGGEVDPEDKPTVSERTEEMVDTLPGEEDRAEVSATGVDEQNAWATQADHSHQEKDRRDEAAGVDDNSVEAAAGGGGGGEEPEWRLCNVKTGPDYIPCLDNDKAIKKLRPENYRRYEHRERHCPDEGPTCLVPLPAGYRRPIEWPKSRDRVWYSNVPHTKLVEVKGHQNWVKVSGQYLTFPGGGTQFIHGALHYIDFLQQSARGIAWGKRTRVVLDVGCGVASFGGYLFDRDVVAMSFAPKDEHEAQVQMALERGIPAISAVMGSKRLPFPSKVFDLVHCARCRVPWHADGGALLLELNRVLRPGGFFVWSATPVYQKLTEDVQIWKAMTALTKSMCWELVAIKKDRLNGIGAAFYRKPTSNECYETRRRQQPPMCSDDDDADVAWYIRLNACMHRVPVAPSDRGAAWPAEWPRRLRAPPHWLNASRAGVYGKPAPEDFAVDYDHWRRVVDRSYLNGLGIDWSRVRNVMDMRATYGGFAAAMRDHKIWVMNVVNVDAADTLPIIFERGLIGMYHDWCESFSTYPRTYDLLHADRLFSKIKERCAVLPVVVEVDRIVRPGGSIVVRDDSGAVGEVERLLRSLHWDVRLTFSKNGEALLYAEKSDWRPELLADPL